MLLAAWSDDDGRQYGDGVGMLKSGNNMLANLLCRILDRGHKARDLVGGSIADGLFGHVRMIFGLTHGYSGNCRIEARFAAADREETGESHCSTARSYWMPSFWCEDQSNSG